VITGGSSGIGENTAKSFAKEGINGLLILDINETLGNKVISQLKSSFPQLECYFRICDVTNFQNIKDSFKFAFDTFGRIDIVCNNAGVGTLDDMGNIDDFKWKRVIDINLIGVIYVAIVSSHYMKKRKGGGVIINTSSLGAIQEMPHMPVYSATKAGVVQFTRSMTPLLEPFNIRMVAICPSLTDTPIMKAFDPIYSKEKKEEMLNTIGISMKMVTDGMLELAVDSKNKKGGAILVLKKETGPIYLPPIRLSTL